MKNLINKIFATMLIIFLIGLLCFFLPDVKAQTNKGFIKSGKVGIGITLFDPSITIAELCRITWKDGKLDIKYMDTTKVSEAIKKFFDWVKGYMENDFYVIPKKGCTYSEGYDWDLYFVRRGKK